MRSRNKMLFFALLAAFSLVVAACGDDTAETTEAAVVETTEAVTETTEAMTETTEAMTETTMGEEAMGGAICEVTDVGGVDDKGFNQTAFEGAQQAAEEMGLEARVLESQAATDFEPNINSFINQGDCELIVTVGFLLGDATLAAAQANPDQLFAIVDVDFFDFDAGEDIVLPNAKELTFQTDEAAFLAGYLAAGMSETGIVGTFGGINIPPVTIFMNGFYWGVQYYNETNGTDVSVLGWDATNPDGGLFTDNFESLDDGRTFAQSLVEEGADIIMPVAGPVGQGSAALASELGTDTLKIIGVDADSYLTDTNNSGTYLTSVLKKMDVSVLETAREAHSGTFEGGVFTGTLANGGVGLAPFHDFEDAVPAELKAELEAIAAGIIDGSISISG